MISFGRIGQLNFDFQDGMCGGVLYFMGLMIWLWSLHVGFYSCGFFRQFGTLVRTSW